MLHENVKFIQYIDGHAEDKNLVDVTSLTAVLNGPDSQCLHEYLVL